MWVTDMATIPVSSPLYKLLFSVTTCRLILANQNETGPVYIMLRVARFPFHRLRRSHRYLLRRMRVCNPHCAENACSRQVRWDGRTMDLEKVNSRLTYSSKADVQQPVKTENAASWGDILLLVEAYTRL